jgi:hypothetical protein
VNALTRLESTSARAERALFDGAEPTDAAAAAKANLAAFVANLPEDNHGDDSE